MTRVKRGTLPASRALTRWNLVRWIAALRLYVGMGAATMKLGYGTIARKSAEISIVAKFENVSQTA